MGEVVEEKEEVGYERRREEKTRSEKIRKGFY